MFTSGSGVPDGAETMSLRGGAVLVLARACVTERPRAGGPL